MTSKTLYQGQALVGDPLFWLGVSLLLVAVSLTAVLVVAIPTLRELSRAARSAEKLFDILGRELPPTLEAIRLTGLEITELTDDVNEGVQHAGRVVKQVDAGLTSARHQADTLQKGTRSFLAGARAAWRAWSQTAGPSSRAKRRKAAARARAYPKTTRPPQIHRPPAKKPDPSHSTARAASSLPSYPQPPLTQSTELTHERPVDKPGEDQKSTPAKPQSSQTPIEPDPANPSDI
jgi:uncharacterized protein YoxC